MRFVTLIISSRAMYEYEYDILLCMSASGRVVGATWSGDQEVD